MSIFQEKISEEVWDIKYRYRQKKIIDHTITDTWHRVATAIAQAEKPALQNQWAQTFFDSLADFKFLPGGRILAGAGTHHKVTLFNCFVMPVTDSLTGIFDSIKYSALTLQEGGGVGYDFSQLRPEGFYAKHSGGTASGPVSFMKIWNAMCSTMQSTGCRRGAMMGILRCDHPDIEEFITIKSQPFELRHFNVSVLVTDEFIQAIKNDEEWQLVFPLSKKKLGKKENIIYRRWSGSPDKIPCQVIKTISARQLWQQMIKSAYEYAEPGVVFEDTINRENNLWYCEWINATNPCGEIPLPNYGACNLGAINLTQFVQHPFTSKSKIDWTGLKNISTIATRFLDNVIDVSNYPLKQQKFQAHQTRRIGLGITGLADALIMLGIQYGSADAIAVAKKIMGCIAETTWETSIELANERGSFPLFDKKNYLAGQFVKQMSSAIQQAIEKYGMRNSHHNTIAPAGTISLLANNISNGIEPVFNPTYKRTMRAPAGGLITFQVMDYALRLWQSQNNDGLPPAWIDTQTLTPAQHLEMQAAVQPFIDNAISKTINLPENYPFEKLNEVYTKAYEMRLKGCTVFRPNPITGSVLSC